MNLFLYKTKFIITLILIIKLTNSYNLSCQNIYWGDLHVHSNLSYDATNLASHIDSLYWHARYVAKLDFIAITDHDIFSNEAQWETSKIKANEYYLPNQFVTLFGYEFTGKGTGGHKIVIYDRDAPRFSMEKYEEEELFNNVQKYKGIIHIAHPDLYYNITAPYANLLFNNKVVKNIEIVNGLVGRHEYHNNPKGTNQAVGLSVQDYISQQKLVGFLGVSDEHHGYLPGKPLTAVIADTLTRNSIFEAIKSRHVFATTGGKRIKLIVKSGNHIMGDSIYQRYLTPKLIEINAKGTDTIVRVEIIKNNQTIEIFYPGSMITNIKFNDIDTIDYTYYYIRLTQKDGNLAWSSPLFYFQNEYQDEQLLSNVLTLHQPYYDISTSEIIANIDLGKEGNISLTIFDSMAKQVKYYNKGFLKQGKHKLIDSLYDLPKGLYFYSLKMKTENNKIYSVTKKISKFH